MMASDTATMASSASSAAGFSSFDRTAARLPMISRACVTSSGRCTNDSATQSAPISSAKSRSRKSFSVSAGIGSTTSGTLTPLRSDSTPPVTTRVRMDLPSLPNTARRSLPSSSSSDWPASITSNSSGCGRQTRCALPGVGSRSSVNSLSGFSTTLPSANTPTRSLGPCRSARMAIGRPALRSISRTILQRA